VLASMFQGREPGLVAQALPMAVDAWIEAEPMAITCCK
jgi:hypothetical protein